MRAQEIAVEKRALALRSRQVPRRSWWLLLVVVAVGVLISTAFLLGRHDGARTTAAVPGAAGPHPAISARTPVLLPPPPAPDPDFLPEPPDTANTASSATELAKTELEQRYEKLLKQYLSALPVPEIGKIVDVTLRNGNSLRGTLLAITPGKVEVEVKYGSLAYPVHEIAPPALYKLFPQRLAHRRALRALHTFNRLGHPEAIAETAAADSSTSPPALAGFATEHEEPFPALDGEQPFAYDPTPAKTPDRLKETIQAFGTWLELQHRRVGGRIAQKIFAKQQSHNVILYLILDPIFQQQEYDTRYRLAEGLWKFWSFRCEANGVVRDLRHAHVVLVDVNGRIVGGSTPRASDDVWVERGAASLRAQRPDR